MMKDNSLFEIYQIPATGRVYNTSLEAFTHSSFHEPAKSENHLPSISTIAALSLLVILGCSLGVCLYSRHQTNRMIAQLQQIIALERVLQKSSRTSYMP